MQAAPEFSQLPKSFWAAVRSVSQCLGYTRRKSGEVRVFSDHEISTAYQKLGLSRESLGVSIGDGAMLDLLRDYSIHRARLLNEVVRPALMDAAEAKVEFEKLQRKLSPTCPLPLNKQKGAKKAPAFLTGMVNMLVEASLDGEKADFDPRALTTVTAAGVPLRTLSRRVDGAFPATLNPVAIWEIKEYYYTTTFGSRVADGVYESLLDGMELEELRIAENIDVLHYLFLDARYTWWDCGRSYLCRIVDMLHMGYVDEVLTGREILERLPVLVAEWVKKYRVQRQTLGTVPKHPPVLLEEIQETAGEAGGRTEEEPQRGSP